ncbi:MAG: TetR/AcrR family transcriptional regulator [Caldilineaceae bacterium]
MAGRTARNNRNPELTLERLTQAALSLFGQYGYERTTIDRLVSDAGLSKGAFYNHFASKEEFFVYLLEQRLRNNQRRIRELYGEVTDPRQWLRSLLESLLMSAHRDRQWAALSIEFMVQGMRDERLGSRLALIHQDWRRLIVDQLRAGAERMEENAHDAVSNGVAGGGPAREPGLRADPETIAAAVVSMIDGLIIHAAFEPDLLSVINIDQLVTQLLGEGPPKLLHPPLNP